MKKRIIIADDDRELVCALARRCRQSGFHVETATDGCAIGIQLFLNRDENDVPPDLIVLDVNMPGDDGFSICEELFREDWLSTIPVVILTGKSDKATIQRCDELGARYVFKAVNVWEQLEPVIYELLDVGFRNRSTASISLDAASESVQHAPPRILWMDHDGDLHSAIPMQLRPYGVEVVLARNGLQAFRRALNDRPNVVVVDDDIQNGFGSDLIRRLKQHSLTRHIPIIAVTGPDGTGLPEDRRIEAVRLPLEADAVLTKPVRIPELLERLRNFVPIAVPAGTLSLA